MCTCRVARRRQTYFYLLTLLEKHHMRGRVIMNSMAVVAAARTTRTRSCEAEKGAQGLKVCSRMRPFAAAFRLMAGSPMRCHACRGVPGCPTLIVTFFDYQPCMLAHANAVLPCALGDRRTRRSCGEGGSRARAAASERLGALV